MWWCRCDSYIPALLVVVCGDDEMMMRDASDCDGGDREYDCGCAGNMKRKSRNGGGG